MFYTDVKFFEYVLIIINIHKLIYFFFLSSALQYEHLYEQREELEYFIVYYPDVVPSFIQLFAAVHFETIFQNIQVCANLEQYMNSFERNMECREGEPGCHWALKESKLKF